MKYCKKPVEIDAYSFRRPPEGGWSRAEFESVLEQVKGDYPDADLTLFGWSLIDGFTISTLEGRMHVSPGDMVIRGVSGEFYPCKPGIFEATYDPTEAKDDTNTES